MVEADETSGLLAEPRKPLSITAIWVRILTAVITFAEGYDIGVSNGAIGLIKKDLNLTTAEIALMVGIFPVVMAPSSLFSGQLADAFGRKPMIAVSASMLCAGMSIWALAAGMGTLLLGRALLGVGIGIGLPVVATYIVECVPAKQRGLYSSLEEIFLNFGILIGFMAGAHFAEVEDGWRKMIGAGAFAPALAFLFLLTPLIPESPRHLHNIGKTGEARRTLALLLPNGDAELESVFKKWKERELDSEYEVKGWYRAAVALFTTHRRMSLAGVGAAVFNQLTGVALISVYSTYIFTQLGMSESRAGIATVIIGVVKFGFLIPTGLCLMDYLGRRSLLILSCFGMMASHMFLTAAIYLHTGALLTVVGACALMAFFFSWLRASHVRIHTRSL